MEVIIPCAGLSSRFPGLRPKYLLTDYSGKLMVERAAAPYIGKYPVTITILAEHDRVYNARAILKEVFGTSIKIVTLDNPTKGPAETVYKTIESGNIDIHSSILIKDSDSFFDSPTVDGNVIYVCDLNKNTHIRNLHAKSYTITNNQEVITTVVEKQIVSNNFCAGGYQFESAKIFQNAFDAITKTNKEIFVSHIIDWMISKEFIFVEQHVENMIDVGTSTDWFAFNNRPTYFCDIDGTLVKNKHPEDPDIEPLQENINVMIKEQDRDCMIVFTTARPKQFESITRKMLDSFGFKNYELIMGVNHSKRILINDFANSLPYPSAEAINIIRDSESLSKYIKGE
jgi:hypothetical protein